MKEKNPKKLILDRNEKFETKVTELLSGVPDDSATSRRGHKTSNNHRLSNNARRILQRIGGAVSSAYDARHSVFLTGTFPGESHKQQSAIAESAAWIVSRLKAWIYKRIGKNIGYYVWEFQKRGTLHLHYVVLVECEYKRTKLIEDFRDEWIKLMVGASERSGCDLFRGRGGRNFRQSLDLLQIYAQECYKSAASYLSKYLGKGGGADFPAPCRMWGATREARHLVALHSISITIPCLPLHKAEDLVYGLEAESDTPSDKRRFWRHRFSDGFTILLYNDTFRMNLSEMQQLENHKRVKPYQGKAISTWAYLQERAMSEPLMAAMSPPGWAAFASLVMPHAQHIKQCSIQHQKEGCMEAREVISIAGIGNFRTRNEARNRLAAVIVEMPND